MKIDFNMKAKRRDDLPKQPIVRRAEWDLIKNSATIAREKHLEEMISRAWSVSERIYDGYRPKPVIPIYPGANDKDNRLKFLVCLATREGRLLNTPDAYQAIQLASQTNDADFFIRLGAGLKLGPISERARDDSRLRNFLLSEWDCRFRSGPRRSQSLPSLPHTDTPGNLLPLCFFTNKALAQICRAKLNNSNLTDEAVRKTRNRLGLKPAKKRIALKVRNSKTGLEYT